jgi:hypothetical protein
MDQVENLELQHMPELEELLEKEAIWQKAIITMQALYQISLETRHLVLEKGTTLNQLMTQLQNLPQALPPKKHPRLQTRRTSMPIILLQKMLP